MWGPLGIFIPDCLESPTPETYASEGSLSSSVVLCRLNMDPGRLSCLSEIPLEVSLLFTVIASPSLFTWGPLDIFLRLFKAVLIAIERASACSFVFFCLSLFSSYSLP